MSLLFRMLFHLFTLQVIQVTNTDLEIPGGCGGPESEPEPPSEAEDDKPTVSTVFNWGQVYLHIVYLTEIDNIL